MENSSSEYRRLVQRVLRFSPDRKDVIRFAHLLYRLSDSYLECQSITRPLNQAEREAIRMKVVRDIVGTRNETGLRNLQKYFQDHTWESISDHALWSVTRRLVNGTACETLLHFHFQDDAGARARVREIVAAAREVDTLSLNGRSTPELRLRESRHGAVVPPWAKEVFESHLWSRTSPGMEMHGVLASVADVLRDCHSYRKAIPACMLAVMC